ncbi:hypothetical protein [Salinibacter phage 7_11]
MARLRDTERREIVQRLACFESPSEVVEYVSEAFDKDVTVRQVCHYDPTRSEETAEKWKRLFEETRESFLSDLDTIPLSHRAVRLRELTDLYERAKEQEEIEKAARMLKQAAKESGGKFTNLERRQHSGSLNLSRDVDLTSLTDEQIERLAEGAPPDEVL